MMKALSGTEPHPSSAIQVESNIGTIIEIRFVGSPSLEDVAAFESDLQALVRRTVKLGKERAVLCTDLRPCQILRPAVSDRIIRLMQNDSPHIERNAFLCLNGAIFGLQLQRLIAESGARDRRRMFTEESQLLDWLTDVTTTAERGRVRRFLNSNHAATE
jgi:hypothetical protein